MANKSTDIKASSSEVQDVAFSDNEKQRASAQAFQPGGRLDVRMRCLSDTRS